LLFFYLWSFIAVQISSRSIVWGRTVRGPIAGGHRSVILDQPVVVAAVRVPDDVVEDDESFELELELARGRRRQRFSFETSEVEVCVLVALNEDLERTDLKTLKNDDQGEEVGMFFKLIFKQNSEKLLNKTKS
jgi:hypothetical protein